MDMKKLHELAASPVDRHSLDEELEQYPYLFQLATDKIADFRHAAGKAKFDAEVVRNALFYEHKKKLEADGNRATEAVINACVLADEDYDHAHSLWLDAKKDLDSAEMLRAQFEARHSAIRLLAQLYQSQYWAPQG